MSGITTYERIVAGQTWCARSWAAWGPSAPTRLDLPQPPCALRGRLRQRWVPGCPERGDGDAPVVRWLTRETGRGPQGSVATKLTELEGLDEMDCSDGCPTAAVMFGVPGVRVLAAEREPAAGCA